MSSAFDYATARAKRHWQQTHSRNLVAWIFRRVGAMRPASAVWICQHTLGDWENARCTGEPAKVWRYDADGLTDADALPDLDRTSAIASTTPVIRFCLDEQTARMIYAEWYGLRAGFGCILRDHNGRWVHTGPAWRS